ncbi:MAG: helix-turn-helix domain-containing protein [Defluviitaleaceae bacterium]|nr:helix-turn-helix domain-containing protein [Defluviitaleaceae bacterium]
MSSLGRRINEYRRQRNITQEQLAETMGVTSQAVSKWENDISCPDISVLPQLADYFGVSLDLLLRGETPGGVQLMPQNQRKDFDRLTLRIVATSADGDYAKINLPMPLIKVGLEIGIPLVQTMQLGNRGAVGDTLKQIDFEGMVKLAESGVIGKLIEAKSADGDNVEIYVD